MAATAQRSPNEKKRAYWLSVLESWAQSGEGEKDFCGRHAIPIRKFRWWRKRLKPSFVPVHVRGGSSEEEASAPLEVVVCGGRVVRVRAGFDAATLVRLVEALEAAPCG